MMMVVIIFCSWLMCLLIASIHSVYFKSCSSSCNCSWVWVCGLWTGDAANAAAAAAVNQRRTQPTIVAVIIFDSLWRNRPRPPCLDPHFLPSHHLAPSTTSYCGAADHARCPRRLHGLPTIPLYFPNDLITDFVCSNYFLFRIPSRVDHSTRHCTHS